MFTGLIEEVGQIATIETKLGNRLLTIKALRVLEDLKVGDSIAVNGICLTVVARDKAAFRVEAAVETLANSTLSEWNAGHRVNLERALKVGDRLGGHLVQGHIDSIANVNRIKYSQGSTLLNLDIPEAGRACVVRRGSIAVDGVSLTIADKSRRSFSVMIIPHTLENTTLGELRPGMRVNIETDIFLRWLAERMSSNDDDDNDMKIHIEQAGWGAVHNED
ncbi:MAG: riboflavin synthase [Calditrichaeota bacterium]|nr:riboflavin synthase [Calditrichota bacterium]